MSDATFIITNIPINVKKHHIYMQNKYINNLIIQYSNNSNIYIYILELFEYCIIKLFIFYLSISTSFIK
jgi:hypothetical protein